VDANPTTRYVTVDGSYVAYQIIGRGPPDLVFMPHWFCNVEGLWDLPPLERFTRHLASLGRVILFDKRGTGLSDSPSKTRPFLESFADDIFAVVNEAGASQVTLIAGDTAGLVAIMFAATHPERVTNLVLVNSFPGLVPPEEYPEGLPPDEMEQHRSEIPRIFLDGDLSKAAPSLASSPRAAAQVIRFVRMSASPGAAYETRSQIVRTDVRKILPAVRVPTLVIHRADNEFYAVAHGRYLAAHIPKARYVELDGADQLMYVGDSDAVLGAIENFLAGQIRGAASERALATVLFTDIVDSTAHASELGDRRWRETLDTYEREALRQIERFRGTQVKSTGDGTLAIFDGPGRAVNCAFALRDAAQLLGLSLRCGLHTGEIEVRGVDVAGIAVHIAQRIETTAIPGEVLVSRTLVDLVAGSELEFEDRGETELKGVRGSWKLYAANG
jgi:class 3 adenylate cyclase